MNQKTIEDMKKVIKDVLEAGKRFHKVFGKTYSSGVIGELLVTQRILEECGRDLCLKDDGNIAFKGNNIQSFDIILILKGKEFRINAKATTESQDGKPKWVRQHARTYTNIVNKNGTTICSPRTDYVKTLFYVFVDVKKWLEKSQTDFYILSDSEAKKTFGKKYSRRYNGKPIRKNESDDMWIEYKDIKKYKDNNFKKFKKV